MSVAIGEKWQKMKKSYMDYLTNNAEFVSTIESWMKTMSYLIAGRISKSHSTVIAELMYTSSNLLTLFNDHLLRKHHDLYKLEEAGVRTLRLMLSSLEALEVFIEIAARRYSSPTVKWIFIFSLELLKTVGRFILLHKYQTGIRHFPLIKRLNRKSMKAETGEEEPTSQPPAWTGPDSYYTTDSGRKIKSISSKYKQPDAAAVTGSSQGPTAMSQKQLYAESLHTMRPLIHLCFAAWFGEQSWKPWIASLVADVSSLSILRQSACKYSKAEESELLRRKFVLLMYLLRSPCYDRYTKMRLLRLLSIFSNIPGAGYITTAIKAYLPEWQSTYFYTWSS